MEIALSNSYQLLLYLLYLNNSWFYVAQNANFPKGPVQYLACQNTQRMYKITLIVSKVHIVYSRPGITLGPLGAIA